jgi:hypothetical protein
MRLLISIGCNNYLNLDTLYGAEQDAEHIFKLMVLEGDYDKNRSKLLLSPTHSDLMAALDEILFSNGSIDVFTIFFAGHGGVKQGSYYLCVSDTHPDKLSTSGLALVHLLTMVSEKKPSQANVIMDSCQSGGAMRDTASLMKPEIIGDIDSSSISLLAACASSQYASEEKRAGILTSEIIKCLTGHERIQDTKPFLDLVEVGRSVSDLVQQKSSDQTPVCWGLNLFGQSKFARNPHFSTDASPKFPTFIESVAPTSSVGKKIRKYSEALWAEYKQVTEQPNPSRLLNLLSTVCTELEKDGESCVPFMRGVATSMSSRAASSPDLLAESDVMAASALALLPFTELDEKRALIRSFLRERSFYNHQGMAALKQSLENNRFALLNMARAQSDFYFLPVRLSKTIGWLASEVVIDHILGNVDEAKNESIHQLLDLVVNTYRGSLVAMSDQQAPYTYVFATACKLCGWDDLAKLVLKATFESFVSVKGAIARVNIQASNAFDYTIGRSFGEPDLDSNLIARPSQLLAALMLSGVTHELAEDWDRLLISLDHKSTNIFLPDNYLDFGAEVIYEGVNYTFTIGHDVWTLGDLVTLFDKNCRSSIQDNESIRSAEVKALGVCAACLFPDRIPIFLECS